MTTPCYNPSLISEINDTLTAWCNSDFSYTFRGLNDPDLETTDYQIDSYTNNLFQLRCGGVFWDAHPSYVAWNGIMEYKGKSYCMPYYDIKQTDFGIYVYNYRVSSCRISCQTNGWTFEIVPYFDDDFYGDPITPNNCCDGASYRKAGGNTPEGTYILTGGAIQTPTSITISAV